MQTAAGYHLASLKCAAMGIFSMDASTRRLEVVISAQILFKKLMNN
jgi:hypothetical protein